MSGSRWVALGVLCLSLLTIVVDNTIVNVALPALVRELDADVSQLQWVVDAYTLVFAGLLLLAGALGDRYGRRRTLLAGLAVFAASSAGAASAANVEALIAWRAAMGAGAAFIMPATLSLLISVFPDERERATAVGIWAATAGLGVALGPVAGGFLIDNFSWGSIFLVNVPLCVAAIVVGRRAIPESRDADAGRLDWPGAALSAAGLIALVYAVIEAPSEGWTSPPVVAAAVMALVLLGGFVRRQRRIAEPLLDLSLFRNPRFSAASTAVMVLFFALFGFLFLSTQYLQFVLGFSPLEAGIRILPYAVAMIVFASLSGRIVRGVGTRRVTTLGMLLFAARAHGGRDRRDGHRLRTPGPRLRDHGRRHGPRGRARDRVDHELTAGRAGQHRLRGERHDSRARRRARRRRRRQHDVGALREPAARRRPRRRPRLARRGTRRRRPRRGQRARGVRPSDVDGVAHGRRRGRARRADGLASSPGVGAAPEWHHRRATATYHCSAWSSSR